MSITPHGEPVSIEVTLGWDNTDFKIPGRIARVASGIIWGAMDEMRWTHPRIRRMEIDIVIGGTDSISQLLKSDVTCVRLDFRVNVRRTFHGDIESDGRLLGIDVMKKVRENIDGYLANDRP